MLNNHTIGNHSYAILTFTLFALGVLLFQSCKTKKDLSSEGFQNEFVMIKGLQCKETINPNAIDSRIGSIDCNEISFNYDYGKFSYPGPLTAIEDFRRTFDNYYHKKFFEYRMIDPKIYNIFLDSVKVLEVRKKDEKDVGFFECKPCNGIAEFTFRGETYLYPFTAAENQIVKEGLTVDFVEKESIQYKFYKEKDALPGLYASPIRNRFKTENTLSLTIKETTLSEEEIQKILKNVTLLEN